MWYCLSFLSDRIQLGNENLIIEKSENLRQRDTDWIGIYSDNNATTS